MVKRDKLELFYTIRDLNLDVEHMSCRFNNFAQKYMRSEHKPDIPDC